MQMLEFGLRRAQGPNGGLTASKYCYIGGFDGTSNVLAGKLFGIPVKGTQAHSFVCSFSSANDLRIRSLKSRDGSTECDLYSLSEEKRRWIMEKVDWGVVESEVSEGELAAFVAYAIAFPSSNMSLIDTYDVLRSGVINFVAVTLALFDLGYKSAGCRIDSGDLSYLSKEVRARFGKVAELYVSAAPVLILRPPRTLTCSRHPSLDWIQSLTIVASNDINEETIMSLNEQSHEIDAFGVGTHLVTCQKQPALGCVYKLVALSGHPKIKLSQEVSKITIPGRKKCFRLYGKTGYCILDLMTLSEEDEPKMNTQILCRHPFEARTSEESHQCFCIASKSCYVSHFLFQLLQESKRALVVASKVESLHQVFWTDGAIAQELPSINAIRDRVSQSLRTLRKDHRRSLNPTPYKVSFLLFVSILVRACLEFHISVNRTKTGENRDEI
ncbi:putative nicotinate phosphoribosyltransferase [Ancylostoma caninum]|uniref:Nicotinate phosphoribosyltransferase n=1 Tax=Ancylostoma caninum TaxID=29170 RepID=A0A368FBP5_ANCCA|nr:putative nicotinate phosphoribosyltransferase [Ancylostoma caninum]